MSNMQKLSCSFNQKKPDNFLLDFIENPIANFCIWHQALYLSTPNSKISLFWQIKHLQSEHNKCCDCDVLR